MGGPLAGPNSKPTPKKGDAKLYKKDRNISISRQYIFRLSRDYNYQRAS